MDGFLLSGVSGHIIHDTRRVKKNGQYPVRFRITYNRDQIYIKSGYDMTEQEFERLDRPRLPQEMVEVRNQLKLALKGIEEAVKDLLKSGDYSHDRLLKMLKGGRVETVNDAYKVRIDEMNEAGQIGTASIYNSALLKIEEFGGSVTFSQITPKWLENFERFALKSIVTSTVSMYLRTLRTIINAAIRQGIVPMCSYPFSKQHNDGKYKIRQGTGTKNSLTVEQFKSILSYVPPTKAMKRSKDIFLLIFYLGGINIKDLLLLQWKDISRGELIYIREKTIRTTVKEIKIRIPLSEQARTIMDKWGNKDKQPTARILPYIPLTATPKDKRRITLNQVRTVNKHLYLIGDALGIEGLSTYVARHTFATVSKNAGISESFIKEVLGHTSIQTTQSYLKAFETDQRRENFAKVFSLIEQQQELDMQNDYII